MLKDFYNQLERLLDHGRYDDAEKLIIDVKEHCDDRDLLTLCSEQIGLYRKMGNRERCMASIDEAIDLVFSLGVEKQLSTAVIFINIATALSAFDECEKALDWFDLSWDVMKDSDVDSYTRASFFNNRSSVYMNLGRYEDALEDLDRAEAEIRKHGSMLDLAVTFVNRGDAYRMMKNERMHRKMLDDALDIFNDPAVSHDGYYAFVIEKCAPAFSDEIKADLLGRIREWRD